MLESFDNPGVIYRIKYHQSNNKRQKFLQCLLPATYILHGVKTCEVFLCFLAIIFLGSIMLTFQWLVYINYFVNDI